MLIAVWIVGGLLALLYLFAGFTKTFTPKDKLQPKMPYVEDFSAGQVKAIGVTEIVGAVGLVVPALTGIAAILTPIAAFGLALVQVVAIVVHVRRKEYSLGFNIGLLVAALFVGVGWLIVL
jgi:uncharacterized membrane protein